LVVLIAAAVILLVVNIARTWYEQDSHPQRFSDIVEPLAAEYNIDPLFIYAIIKTESSFNPSAESHLGARGLMQIMPDTFDWIQWRWFGDDGLTFDDMYTPEHNIRYGVRLITYNIEEVQNTDSAIAAYHAGINAVKRWLDNDEYSSDGYRLDRGIPISDTAHYVNKVNKAYKIYQRLYGGE
jgi:soluble lytic murein transglycosylase